jgi:SNF2 family DNA or RNA helicase
LEGYILSFEQGLGKTLTSVALAEALGKDQVVIVCPNTIRENWAMEIKEYFNKYEDDDTFYDEVYVTNNKKYAVTAKTKYFIVNHE